MLLDLSSTAAFLQQHDGYLILTHKHPDGDTIGCAAGLCALLRAMGKTAWALPSLDINGLLSDFLEGYTAPEDYVPDTIVSVDVASLGLLPPNAQPYQDRIDLAIDHHPSNTGFARRSFVEGDRAACGEIIWEICQAVGILNAEIAKPLYAAVALDTGCFVYSNTSSHTHMVAASLMEYDIPVAEINKQQFRTKSRKRMLMESMLFQRIEFYHGGTVAFAPVTQELIASSGATPEDMDDVSSFAGQIEGVQCSITMKELANSECRFSVRTNEKVVNACSICTHLGGGGHAAAAGCSFFGTMDDAKAAILAAVDEELAKAQG